MSTTKTPKAKPGLGFDADGRASERESADFKIGGETYTRRRKNWEATRTLRALLREQDRANGRQEKAQRELDELDGTAIERLEYQLDEANADGKTKIDPASDRGKRMTAKLGALEVARDELDDDERDERIDVLRAQLDTATDEADDVAYRLIALLLRTPDGSPPDVDFLKEELDVEDAGDLAAKLIGGGEPDPTATVTETATS